MQYEGQICRGPMERGSFMLPAAVGCRYNACTFCMLFKHLKYRELPLEQMEAEILRVKNMGGAPETVFLGDGNAFSLPFERLEKILEMINLHLPSCKSVNMDATVTDISEKSDGQLKALCELGARHLYLGIESGLDDVLAFTNKDHTLAQAYEQIERLQRAGLIFDAHMMTGIAGKGRGIENAEATASFFNRTQPSRIINFSLFVHRRSPLYKSVENGSFAPASERENLQEAKSLIELLDLKSAVFDGFHDMVTFRVRGELPQKKEKMISLIEKKISETPEDIYCIVK